MIRKRSQLATAQACGERLSRLYRGEDNRPLLLNPATGIWRWGPPEPQPGLTETPAIWTGHEIIEWGGGTPHTVSGGSECCQLVPAGVALASRQPTTN